MKTPFAILICSVVFALLLRHQQLPNYPVITSARASISDLFGHITKPQSIVPSSSSAPSSSNPTHQDTPNLPLSTPFEAEVPEITVAQVMSVARAIAKAFQAVEKSEGAGARVRRSIGVPQLRNFSPFLMLDHFTIGENAGFPDHPHRGQETITYLLSGSVDHEDFAGNKGTIRSGDLQFMTAGRGIVHAEMPGKNEDGSPNVGLQLWVDLPKKLKYCEPRYRDLRAAEIPKVSTDDDRVEIKIISGNSHGVDSVKDLAYTPVWLLDVTMKPGGKLSQPIPKDWNAFVYTLEGQVIFGENTKVGPYYNVVFEQEGDGINAVVPDNAGGPARFVIIAGQPHDHKIVQYGPFVVTSTEEVYKAMEDYQSGANGFERARGWQSEIGKRMLRFR